jgi:DNA-binding transcriptional LysR family regulator
MELRHIRYFVAVAEELHFGRAAKRLHISQPPLSQQIQALETEIDAKLFERSKHRVALTEAGAQFLIHAYSILDLVQNAVATAQRAQKGQVGSLRIGFTGSAPYTDIMPRLIARFRKLYPHVELRLVERSSTEQVADLLKDALDLGFTRALPSSRSSQVCTYPLLRERLVVALPTGHKLASHNRLMMRMLADEDFVTYGRAVGTGLYEQLINLSLEAGFTPRVVQEARETSTIIGLVAAGIGISLVPSGMQKIRVANVVYRELRAEGATTEMLLVSRSAERSVLVQNFLHLAMGGEP